jgi:hypothetical protein
VEPALQHEATTVLAALARVRQVFGADEPPADPPAFVAPPDLECNLGRGWF